MMITSGINHHSNQLYTIQVVIFEGFDFCGLGTLDNFVGLYFHGIV